MSLILEALRRSEAERRRGEAPDVLAPVEVPRPAARSGLPTSLRWGLAATAAALLLGGAWWQLAPRGTTAPTAASTEVVTQTDASSQAPLATPTPPPAASVRAVTTAPAPSTPSLAQPPQPMAVADADAVAPSPVDATPAVPIAASSALPASVGAPSVTPAEPPVPLPSSEFISPEATVRLAELSSEERAQLPALKVTMHMWAPDAAHRFVIIDGTRLAEGDRVADATISAILADGVTLAWRGRQIRLPIR